MSIVSDGVDGFLDPILGVLEADLTVQLEGRAVTAYLRGAAEMTSWGRTHITDRPLVFEGPPMEEAIDYAKKRGAQLVKGMNRETKERLANVISDGIKRKRGIPGLQRDIRAIFSEMSRSRAQMIARTESSEALQQSFMDRSKQLKITGKEWIEVSPLDQDCIINAAAGVIKIGAAFPSGHQRPPAHPHCECALAPVMI